MVYGHLYRLGIMLFAVTACLSARSQSLEEAIENERFKSRISREEAVSRVLARRQAAASQATRDEILNEIRSLEAKGRRDAPHVSFDQLVGKRAAELAKPGIDELTAAFAERLAEMKVVADAESARIQAAAELAKSRPSSGGKIVARGKTVLIPPEAKRGTPPDGMQWVFPERSMQPFVLAPIEPPNLTSEQRAVAAYASFNRMITKWPFLANKEDSRTKQFTEFLTAAHKNARYGLLFSLTNWREYAADECALLYEWRI